MATTIKIGETTYGVRRQTYGAMLAQQDALDDMQDAQDRLSAVNLRMEHTGRRLNALAESDGEIDAEEEKRLLELRKQLRRQGAAVMREVVDAQLRLIHHRLIDGPPPERLMELVDPEQAAEILDQTDQDPQVPSETNGENS